MTCAISCGAGREAALSSSTRRGIEALSFPSWSAADAEAQVLLTRRVVAVGQWRRASKPCDRWFRATETLSVVAKGHTPRLAAAMPRSIYTHNKWRWQSARAKKGAQSAPFNLGGLRTTTRLPPPQRYCRRPVRLRRSRKPRRHRPVRLGPDPVSAEPAVRLQLVLGRHRSMVRL